MVEEAYADSSFLFSLVAKDSRSPQATQYMLRAAVPLFFTPFHRIEVRNALRNAAARGEITEQIRRAAFQHIEDDLHERILVHAAIEWTSVFRIADELSEKFASREGQRTIDLLHVVTAMELRTNSFLSFDRRQRRLAQAAGLRVKP